MFNFPGLFDAGKIVLGKNVTLNNCCGLVERKLVQFCYDDPEIVCVLTLPICMYTIIAYLSSSSNPKDYKCKKGQERREYFLFR